MSEDFDLSALEKRLDEQERRERELIEKHARKNLRSLLKRLKAFTVAELSIIENDLQAKKSGVADAVSKAVRRSLSPMRRTEKKLNLFGWLSLTGISLLLLLSLVILWRLPAGASSGQLDRSKIVNGWYPAKEIPKSYWKE